jgi:Mn2+/Fe2+ NRAMP family transporter
VACVNDTPQYERTQIITPWLRYFASITLFGILRTTFFIAAVLGACVAATYRFYLAKQWVEDVEYEGNVDADKALEDLDDGEDGDGKKDDGKDKNAKGKGGKK